MPTITTDLTDTTLHVTVLHAGAAIATIQINRARIGQLLLDLIAPTTPAATDTSPGR